MGLAVSPCFVEPFVDIRCDRRKDEFGQDDRMIVVVDYFPALLPQSIIVLYSVLVNNRRGRRVLKEHCIFLPKIHPELPLWAILFIKAIRRRVDSAGYSVSVPCLLTRPTMPLSEQQQASLEQLWAVTASDTTAARERDERLLRENGWDVQVSQTYGTVTRTVASRAQLTLESSAYSRADLHYGTLGIIINFRNAISGPESISRHDGGVRSG